MNGYYLTVSSILDAECMNKVVTKNITVSCTIDIPNSVIDLQKQYNVIFINSHFISLSSVYNNIKDSLCICTSTLDNKIITEIRNELEELGAFALLCKVKPTDAKSTLPVFFVTNEYYIPDIPYFSATSIRATVHSQNADLSFNKKDVHKPNYYENIIISTDRYSRNDNRYMNSYFQVLQTINSKAPENSNVMLSRQSTRERKCSNIAAKPHLYNIGTLIALALICTTDIDMELERQMILFTVSFLDRLDVERYDHYQVKDVLKFLKTEIMGDGINALPQNILYQFLTANVDYWGRKDDCPQRQVRCLWLLHACGLVTRYCKDDWNLLRYTIDSDIFHKNSVLDEIKIDNNIKTDLHLLFQEDYYSLIDELLIRNTPLTADNVKQALVKSKKINTIQKYVYQLDIKVITLTGTLADTLRTVIRTAMTTQSSICQKLLLLNSCTSFNKQYILDAIPDLISSESPKFLGLKEFFIMASITKNMFSKNCISADEFFAPIKVRKYYKTIADLLVHDCVHVVRNNPIVLKDLPIPNDQSPAFYKALVDAIQLEMQSQYKTLSDASSLYNRVMIDYPVFDGNQLVHQIASKLFDSALEKWNPQSMLKIRPMDKLTIDMVYSVGSGKKIVNDIKNNLSGITADWTKRFDAKEVVAHEMQHVLELMESCTLDSHEKSSNILLPTAKMIQLQLNGIECSLLGDESKNIQNILTTTVNEQEHIVTSSPGAATENAFPKVEITTGTLSSHVDVTYVSMKQESHLQRWLSYHCLPPSVADILMTWGVRTVDDIFLLLSQKDTNNDVMNEMILKLPLLDRIKLCQAAAATSTSTTSSVPSLISNGEILDSDIDYNMCDSSSAATSTNT